MLETPVAEVRTEIRGDVPRHLARFAAELMDYDFHLFTEGVTGRGNVLYHRYDGHYGLITPAD